MAAKPDVSQPAGAAAGEEAADEAGIAAAVAGGDAAGDGAAPMDEDGGEGAALLQPYPSARGLPLPPRGGGGLDLTSPVATTARGAVTASPGRLFKAMLRHGNLELSFTVRIHPLYPSHPPSFSSLALLEFPPPEKRKSGAKGVRVGGVNLLTWLEAEANVAALQLVPDGGKRECLQQQLTHLALCLDQLAEGRAADSSADVVRQLAARQQLRGRARLPPPVALLAAETKASVQV